MAKPQVPIGPPPDGYKVVVIGKNDNIPQGALVVQALDGSGPVKRCYYVPDVVDQNAYAYPGAPPANAYGPPQHGSPPPNYGYPPPGYPQQGYGVSPGYPVQGNHGMPAYPPPQGAYGYPPPHGYPPAHGHGAPHGAPPPGYPPQGYNQQAYPPQAQHGYGQPPPQAAPVARNIVRGSAGPWDIFGYASSKTNTYIFKESLNAYATGDAKVHDDHGNVALLIKDHHNKISLGRDILLSDGRKIAEVGKSTGGASLIDMAVKMMKSGREIRHVDGTVICSLSADHFALGTKATLSMADGNKLRLDGGLRGKKFELTHKKATLVQVKKKSSLTAMATGKDTYTVTVSKGVDYVFAMCICLIIDDLFHDEEQNGAF